MASGSVSDSSRDAGPNFLNRRSMSRMSLFSDDDSTTMMTRTNSGQRKSSSNSGLVPVGLARPKKGRVVFAKFLAHFAAGRSMNVGHRPAEKLANVIYRYATYCKLLNNFKIEMEQWSNYISSLKAYTPRICREIICTKTFSDCTYTTVEGVIVFADVTGYSKLAELLDSTAKKNRSRNSHKSCELVRDILSKYFEVVMEIFTSAGGDIVKVAGDAIMVFWSAEGKGLEEATRQAASATLAAIALSHESNGFSLSLHAGLASGQVHFHLIGKQSSRMFFVPSGPVVHQATSAANIGPGLIVMHDAMRNSNGCLITTPIEDSVEPPTHTHPPSPNNKIAPARVRMLRQSSLPLFAPLNLPSSSPLAGSPVPRRYHRVSGVFDPNSILVSSKNPEFLAKTRRSSSLLDLLRPSRTPSPIFDAFPLPQMLENKLHSFLNEAVSAHLEKFVTKRIAELRWVTVMFLKVETEVNFMSAESANRVLQDISLKIMSIIATFRGSIKEFGIEDKGVVLLAGFGVPPYAHSDDSARAVFASMALLASLSRDGYRCSIGVTTGWTFCGSIGKSRREYAIVGAIVNLAARLMMIGHATGVGILCSSETCSSAHRNIDFEELAPVKVKGREQPVQIFTPSKATRKSARARESKERAHGFESEVAALKMDMSLALERRQGLLIVIEGGHGVGKSKLLSGVANSGADLGLHFINVNMSEVGREDGHCGCSGGLKAALKRLLIFGTEFDVSPKPDPDGAHTTYAAGHYMSMYSYDNFCQLVLAKYSNHPNFEDLLKIFRIGIDGHESDSNSTTLPEGMSCSSFGGRSELENAAGSRGSGTDFIGDISSVVVPDKDEILECIRVFSREKFGGKSVAFSFDDGELLSPECWILIKFLLMRGNIICTTVHPVIISPACDFLLRDLRDDGSTISSLPSTVTPTVKDTASFFPSAPAIPRSGTPPNSLAGSNSNSPITRFSSFPAPAPSHFDHGSRTHTPTNRVSPLSLTSPSGLSNFNFFSAIPLRNPGSPVSTAHSFITPTDASTRAAFFGGRSESPAEFFGSSIHSSSPKKFEPARRSFPPIKVDLASESIRLPRPETPQNLRFPPSPAAGSPIKFKPPSPLPPSPAPFPPDQLPHATLVIPAVENFEIDFTSIESKPKTPIQKIDIPPPTSGHLFLTIKSPAVGSPGTPSVRQEEIERTLPFRCVTVQVSPLNQEAVGKMVVQVMKAVSVLSDFDDSPTDRDANSYVCSSDVASFLHERTQGIPLFVKDWTTQLWNTRRLDFDCGIVTFKKGVNFGMYPPPPPCVHSVIASLKDDMSPSERLLLQVCSVMGKHIDPLALFRMFPFTKMGWQNFSSYRRMVLLSLELLKLVNRGVLSTLPHPDANTTKDILAAATTGSASPVPVGTRNSWDGSPNSDPPPASLSLSLSLSPFYTNRAASFSSIDGDNFASPGSMKGLNSANISLLLYKFRWLLLQDVISSQLSAREFRRLNGEQAALSEAKYAVLKMTEAAAHVNFIGNSVGGGLGGEEHSPPTPTSPVSSDYPAKASVTPVRAAFKTKLKRLAVADGATKNILPHLVHTLQLADETQRATELFLEQPPDFFRRWMCNEVCEVFGEHDREDYFWFSIRIPLVPYLRGLHSIFLRRASRMFNVCLLVCRAVYRFKFKRHREIASATSPILRSRSASIVDDPFSYEGGTPKIIDPVSDEIHFSNSRMGAGTLVVDTSRTTHFPHDFQNSSVFSPSHFNPSRHSHPPAPSPFRNVPRVSLSIDTDGETFIATEHKHSARLPNFARRASMTSSVMEGERQRGEDRDREREVREGREEGHQRLDLTTGAVFARDDSSISPSTHGISVVYCFEESESEDESSPSLVISLSTPHPDPSPKSSQSAEFESQLLIAREASFEGDVLTVSATSPPDQLILKTDFPHS